MTFFPSRTSAFHDIIPAFTHLRKSLDAPVDSVVVNSSIEESSVLLAYLCFLLSIGPLQVAFPISTLQLRAFTPEKAFPLCHRRADEHARCAPPPPLHIAPATSVASPRARRPRRPASSYHGTPVYRVHTTHTDAC